jgi:hypothetical protein
VKFQMVFTKISLFLSFFYLFSANMVLSTSKVPSTYMDPNNPGIFSGCPENAECDQSMGRLRKSWHKLLGRAQSNQKNAKSLDQFRRKYGILTQAWTLPKISKKYSPIIFDSSCTHLRKRPKDAQVKEGQLFIKYTKKNQIYAFNGKKTVRLSSKDGVILDTLLLESGNKIQKFLIPRGETPIGIKDRDLRFLISDSYLYYSLLISSSGKWHVIDNNLKDTFSSESTVCSKDLLKAAKKISDPHNIYQGHFCRKLYDEITKKGYTYLVKWSCD